MSGLCREGQLEIAVQEARKVRPDFGDDELLELAKAVHDFPAAATNSRQ